MKCKYKLVEVLFNHIRKLPYTYLHKCMNKGKELFSDQNTFWHGFHDSTRYIYMSLFIKKI
jgi:hypothetical protein